MEIGTTIILSLLAALVFYAIILYNNLDWKHHSEELLRQFDKNRDAAREHALRKYAHQRDLPLINVICKPCDTRHP